ncbi:hypothetical protein [Salarchaeum japonicum]|uniref:DUF4233 domain-containing protein n=1 Tax=Salarchaeum japonicum TaxID=555573 RepID=A0AAV3T0L1_9EURY|nr:hypothetical protein [Salarchaeum japonicum]
MALDRHDAAAGVLALLGLAVFAYTLLVTFTPIFGGIVALAALAVAALVRARDLEHAAVVALLAAVVVAATAATGTLYGLLLGLILAAVCYVGWRVVTGRTG